MEAETSNKCKYSEASIHSHFLVLFVDGTAIIILYIILYVCNKVESCLDAGSSEPGKK